MSKRESATAIVLAMILALAIPTTAICTTLLSDSFDGYTPGFYPPAPWWNMFSGSDGHVSTDYAHSGAQSYLSASDPNWARWDCVTLTIPDQLMYRTAVYLTAADRGGAVGFGFVQPGTSNTGWWANAIAFSNDGSLWFVTRTAGSTPLGTWSPNTWIVVEARIDYVALTAVILIDGAVVATDVPTDPKILPDTVYGSPVPLDQFGLFGDNFGGGGTSVIYYDDILVTDEVAVPVESMSWGRIKSLFE